MNPEKLLKISERLEAQLSGISTYFIRRIVKDILKLFTDDEGNVQIMPSTIHRLKMLDLASGLHGEMAEFITKDPTISAASNNAWEDAAQDINKQIYSDTEKIVDAINDKLPDSEKIAKPTFTDNVKNDLTEKEIRMLDGAVTRTNGELYNLTQTTADSVQTDFIDICDKAYFNATHGTDVNTAIMDAIKEASKRGIKMVNYTKNGRTVSHSVEVALARAIRTGINQATAAVTLTRCAEMGIDYVKTSQHLGARDIGSNDYRSHVYWQGNVYKLDWNNPALSQYKPSTSEQQKIDLKHRFLRFVRKHAKKYNYPDFVTECGYGDVQGICGANCRHTFTQFYPGVNVDNGFRYDREENLERYEKAQKARAMERQIRSLKKEKEGLKAALEELPDNSDLSDRVKGELKKVNSQINKKSEQYSEYCQSNNISRANWRLQITSGIPVNSSKKATGAQ